MNFVELQAEIEQLASRSKMRTHVEQISEDPVLHNIAITGRSEADLYLLIHHKDDEVFIYDLSSSTFPRELYDDTIPDGFSLAERSQEILNTVRQLLSNQLVFTSQPRLLNKDRGYIIVPIDGKETKIHMKQNYWGLNVKKTL